MNQKKKPAAPDEALWCLILGIGVLGGAGFCFLGMLVKFSKWALA
jgi:hypothetical protein